MDRSGMYRHAGRSTSLFYCTPSRPADPRVERSMVKLPFRNTLPIPTPPIVSPRSTRSDYAAVRCIVTANTAAEKSVPSAACEHLLSRHEFYGFYRASCSVASYAEPCISYGQDVCPSIRPSVCLSVYHTLALSQNDAN